MTRPQLRPCPKENLPTMARNEMEREEGGGHGLKNGSGNWTRHNGRTPLKLLGGGRRENKGKGRGERVRVLPGTRARSGCGQRDLKRGGKGG